MSQFDSESCMMYVNDGSVSALNIEMIERSHANTIDRFVDCNLMRIHIDRCCGFADHR